MGNWLPMIRSPDAEINWFRDRMVARSRDLARNSADAKRMTMQRQVMGKGMRKVGYGGLSLDGMLEAIHQDPQFNDIKTINDLTRAIDKAARQGIVSMDEIKAKALADLVYHTERDIAGRHAEDEAGFAAFADAVDEVAGTRIPTPRKP